MSQSGAHDSPPKRDYLKQQEQLRAMARATNARSADDMIEDLLSKKEIFKKKESASGQGSPFPKWLSPGEEEPYYLKVWGLVDGGGGYADTAKLTNLLLSSHLSTDALGFIWSLTNKTVAGVLTQQETYFTLGLVALAQGGYRFNSVAALNDLNQAVIPTLDLSTLPLSCSLPPTIPLRQPSSLPPSSDDSGPFLKPLSLPYTTGPSDSPSVPLTNSLVDSLFQPSPPSGSDSSNPLSSIDSMLFSSPSRAAPSPRPPLPLSSLKPSLSSLPPQPAHIVPPGCELLSQGMSLLDVGPSDSKSTLFPPLEAPKPPSTLLPRPSLKREFDLFGDFQSPPMTLPPPGTTPLLEEEDDEFDDFMSADLSAVNASSLTVLEVGPRSGDAPPPLQDLFPKCVIKKEDDDLVAVPPPVSEPSPPPFTTPSQSNDKYSALRLLEPDSPPQQDDFGDFLAAEPSSLIPPLGHDDNIQVKCLEACVKVLEEGVGIFEAITDQTVLGEVTSDPRGIKYLEELVEVKKVGERILSKLKEPSDLCLKLNSVSQRLEPFTSKHSKSFMEYSRGPKCGVCLSEEGPHHVRYGINSFHAPCANLLLHFVQPSLPIAPLL